MIGLADCNNFFVSCERSINPALDGKPVVVLSNNDGCVVARSNESKRLGVKMGQPAFEIRDMIEKHRIIALSGNHLLYRDISLRVHDIFRRFVPSALDYSVDESFLDVNGIPVDVLPEIGEAIYDACWKEMRIPVTIGFAPTKTLAKIATEVSKKGGQRLGIIYDEADAVKIYDNIPIYDLWGVGRRLTKMLYQNGVYTIRSARTGIRGHYHDGIGLDVRIEVNREFYERENTQNHHRHEAQGGHNRAFHRTCVKTHIK